MTSLVVALQWPVEAGGARETRSGAEGELAHRIRDAIDRAAVAGAYLVGVAGDGASFAFDDDAMEEAMEFALALATNRGAPTPRGDDANAVPLAATLSPIEFREHEEPGEPGAPTAPFKAGGWQIGVGRGGLEAVRDERGFVQLSVGLAASRAAALARAARAGEVLVDALTPAVREGQILSTGRRLAANGDRLVRGVVVDLREPWRREQAAFAPISEPRVVGRESGFDALGALEPGGIAIVHAERGAGGTRFLEELAARTAHALVVRPTGCSAEPLGALRVALASLFASRPPPALPPRLVEPDRALRGGQGVEIDTASELLLAYLAPRAGEHALVAVDDAALVDDATLEAIGHAASVSGSAVAVVARLDVGEATPPPLAALIPDAISTLRPLLPHESAALVDEACRGRTLVADEVRRRWARRGGGSPLATLESLRYAFRTGELAVRDGVVTTRSRSAGRGRKLSASWWIGRRLAALAVDHPAESLVVATIAFVGYGIDRAHLEDVAAELGLPGFELLDRMLEHLIADGFVFCSGVPAAPMSSSAAPASAAEGMVPPPMFRSAVFGPASRTLRETAMERCGESTRTRIHAALAAATTRAASGLELAEGAYHAALAGDHHASATLAARAAERAHRARLTRCADALSSFARGEGAHLPMDSSLGALSPSQAEPLWQHDSPPSDVSPGITQLEPSPAALVSPRTPPGGMSSRNVEQSSSPSQEWATLGMIRIRTSDIALLPDPSEVALGGLESQPTSAPESACDAESNAPFHPPNGDRDPFGAAALAGEGSSSSPQPESRVAPRSPTGGNGGTAARSSRAPGSAPDSRDSLRPLVSTLHAAFAARDIESIDRLLDQLHIAGASRAALLRLRSLAGVVRGDIAAGIRFARCARREAGDDAEAARAGLAFALALEAAGQRDDALLEALAALSLERALRERREGHDVQNGQNGQAARDDHPAPEERGGAATLHAEEAPLSTAGEAACTRVVTRLLR